MHACMNACIHSFIRLCLKVRNISVQPPSVNSRIARWVRGQNEILQSHELREDTSISEQNISGPASGSMFSPTPPRNNQEEEATSSQQQEKPEPEIPPWLAESSEFKKLIATLKENSPEVAEERLRLFNEVENYREFHRTKMTAELHAINRRKEELGLK